MPPGPVCQRSKSTTPPSILKAVRRPTFMCRLLLRMEEHFINDWDLHAVVRSCSAGGAAPEVEAEAEAEAEPPRPRAPPEVRGSSKDSSLYDLEYLDLDHKPFSLSATPSSQAWAVDAGHEVMISFPAAAGAQPPARKPAIRTPRPKRSKKSQLKKVVCEVPAADGGVSSDLWAWRKYGQKPIKGSPYPRGYYKCSSMKGCMARKMVERSPAKPGLLVITYLAEHCHPVPTQINALAGTTRHKSSAAEDHPTTSPKSLDGNSRHDDSGETLAMPAGGIGEAAAAAGDEGEFWSPGMGLDEFLGSVDGDFDHVFDEEDDVLEQRLSL